MEICFYANFCTIYFPSILFSTFPSKHTFSPPNNHSFLFFFLFSSVSPSLALDARGVAGCVSHCLTRSLRRCYILWCVYPLFLFFFTSSLKALWWSNLKEGVRCSTAKFSRRGDYSPAKFSFWLYSLASVKTHIRCADTIPAICCCYSCKQINWFMKTYFCFMDIPSKDYCRESLFS